MGATGEVLRTLLALREKGVGTDVTLRCSGAIAPAGADEDMPDAAAAPPAASAVSLRCHSAVLVAQGEFWQRLCFGPLARRALPSSLRSLSFLPCASSVATRIKADG